MSSFALDMAYFAAVTLATPTAYAVAVLIVAGIADMIIGAVANVKK